MRITETVGEMILLGKAGGGKRTAIMREVVNGVRPRWQGVASSLRPMPFDQERPFETKLRH
jgi:hypothetical protein